MKNATSFLFKMKAWLFFVLLIFSFKTSLAQSNLRASSDSLLQLLPFEKVDTQKVEIYFEIAWNMLSIHPDSVGVYGKKVLELSERINYQKGIINGNILLGISNEMQSNYQEAYELHREANKRARAKNDFRLIGRSSLGIARSLEFLGKYDSARINLLTNVILIQDTTVQGSRLKGMLFGQYGKLSERLGENEKALRYYLKAQDEFNKNPASSKEQDLSVLYSNMAVIYYKLEDYPNALKEAKKALEIYQNNKSPARIGGTMTSIGGIFLKLGQLDSAMFYLNKSLPILEKIDLKLRIAVCKRTQADVFFVQKKHNQAIRNYEIALASFKALDMKSQMKITHLSLAKIFTETKKLKKAKEHLDEAILLSNESKNKAEEISILKLLVDYNEKQGDYKSAFKNFKTYKVIEDSIFNTEKVNKLSELQTQYETIEKENEIKLLEKDNQLKAIQLSQQRKNILWGFGTAIFFLGLALSLFFQQKKLRATKKKLEVSLGEKETLLKEIHHRVKNNLQLITSLLTLQAKGKPEQTIEEFLYKGQNRVKTIALIHERLYRTDNLSSINFETYAKELLDGIFASYGISDSEIQYQLNAENTELDIEKAIPLGLILNELVSNSLKHAFENQKKGRLQIDLKDDDGRIHLTVRDNGKGYDTNLQKDHSMGLQLVKLLVQQLRGTFKLENRGGTFANIVFQKTPLIS